MEVQGCNGRVYQLGYLPAPKDEPRSSVETGTSLPLMTTALPLSEESPGLSSLPPIPRKTVEDLKEPTKIRSPLE